MLARPAVSSVILGARTFGRLDGNPRRSRPRTVRRETALLAAASDPGSRTTRTASAGGGIWAAVTLMLPLRSILRVWDPDQVVAASGRFGAE